MALSFINSNWFRQYPFKGNVSLMDINGNVLPNDLIVSCRILVDISNINIYVSKIYINNGFVSIEFSSGSNAVGVAKGTVTQSNQMIPITPLISTISGTVMIGNLDTALAESKFIFDSSSAVLEPSVVTIFTPPSISKLVCKGVGITGAVLLDPTNMTLSITGNTISLAVIAPNDVASRADKTSTLLTCNNPVISGINSVTPSVTNNIDVYGISPVTIATQSGQLTIGTEGISIADVCNPVNIPPTDSTDTYLTDITTTDTPEWKTWPQYNI